MRTSNSCATGPHSTVQAVPQNRKHSSVGVLLPLWGPSSCCMAAHMSMHMVVSSQECGEPIHKDHHHMCKASSKIQCGWHAGAHGRASVTKSMICIWEGCAGMAERDSGELLLSVDSTDMRSVVRSLLLIIYIHISCCFKLSSSGHQPTQQRAASRLQFGLKLSANKNSEALQTCRRQARSNPSNTFINIIYDLLRVLVAGKDLSQYRANPRR
jgi:hypothetical protein